MYVTTNLSLDYHYEFATCVNIQLPAMIIKFDDIFLANTGLFLPKIYKIHFFIINYFISL